MTQEPLPQLARDAAALLLQARASGTLLPGLPEALVPRTAAAAYAIQQYLMQGLGDIGGWKVGAPGPAAEPNCAPMPAGGIHRSPAVLAAADFAAPFMESEIAFLLGADLPVRDTPYSANEVGAAIASCHPAIEVVQSRFADPDAAGALANLADLIRHGAFIYGSAIEGWQGIDFPSLAIVQTIEGGPTRQGVGNPAGDMMRLMLWLANEGAVWAGGLRAGQIVTCGSWTGMTPAGRGEVVTAFAGVPPVVLRLE
jgi:2-keto-4-pentenoate hydratase